MSFVVGALLMVLIIGGANILALQMLANSPTLPMAQKTALAQQASSFYQLILWLGLLTVAGLTPFALFLSYKFIGPLNRLELWMEQNLLGQDPPFLTLRKKDEMMPVSAVLGRLLHKYSARLRRQ